MKKILIFIAITLFASCGRNFDKYRQCTYNILAVDSAQVVLPEFEKYGHLLEGFNMKGKQAMTFIYKSGDEPSDSTYVLLILGYVVEDTVRVLKLERGIMDIYYSYDKAKVKKLIKGLAQLPQKYIVRDCGVSDGGEGIFYLYKNNKLLNHFKSYGYDCWVFDDSKIPDLYKEVFKHINKVMRH